MTLKLISAYIVDIKTAGFLIPVNEKSMKAKIIEIEVDRSRLYFIECNGPEYNYCKIIEEGEEDCFDAKVGKPIIPVLVSDEKAEDPLDLVVFKNSENNWSIGKYEDMMTPTHNPSYKLITQDTEELYEDIVNGKIEFDVWYEFESHKMEQLTGLHQSKMVDELSRPLRVVDESYENFKKNDPLAKKIIEQGPEKTKKDLEEIRKKMQGDEKTPYEKSIENDTPEEVRERIDGYEREGYPKGDPMGIEKQVFEEKRQLMTLEDLKKMVDWALESPQNKKAVVCIPNNKEGMCGGTPCTFVRSANMGFDWDSGMFFIHPENKMKEIDSETFSQ